MCPPLVLSTSRSDDTRPADTHTHTAIMARRTAGKPPCWTPSERGAFRDKLRGSRGGLLALSWAFVLVFSVLSCGYCDAESEFSILEEAQVLAEQMKKLSSQELGVFTMQVRVFCCCVKKKKKRRDGRKPGRFLSVFIE